MSAVPSFRRGELLVMTCLLMNSMSWGARASDRPVREILQGGVEQFGLFEMRGVAGVLEADGAGVGQSGDEMVGGVVAVELALRAVDDQGRVLDPVEQSAHVLADQRLPRPSRSPPASLRANSQAAQSASLRARAPPAGRRSPGRRSARSSRNRRGWRCFAPRRPRARGRDPIPRRSSPARSCRRPPRRRSAPRRGRRERAKGWSRRATSRRRSRPRGRARRPARRRRPPSARRSGAAPSSPAEAPWPRRSMAMIRKSSASAACAVEEAAMRHQPVQQHDRRAARRCRDRRSASPSEAVKPCKTPPQGRRASVRGSAAGPINGLN